MGPRTGLFRYLKSGHGRWSLSLVLGCAVLLAYFAGRTFITPPPKSYVLDFGGAAWIEHSPHSNHGYFRKTLYLGANVEHAWIQVAATDQYEIFVNSRRVDAGAYNAACVTGIYDLNGLLHEGKNVIAVHVFRTSYPGSAQLRARGRYVLVGSPPQEFVSDTTWKASPLPEGIVNGPEWKDDLLADEPWDQANRVTDSPRPATVLPASFPPFLMDTAPAGMWIGPAQNSAREATFQSSFVVPRPRAETWLQIAATGAFEVVVNGRLAAARMAVPESRTGDGGPLPGLLAYDIRPWVHQGTNSVFVRVRAENGPVALFVNAVTHDDWGMTRFSSDGNWEVPSSGVGAEARSLERAVVVGYYGDPPLEKLTQSMGIARSAPTDDLRFMLQWAALVLATISVILFGWIAAWFFLSSRTGKVAAQFWTADAFIHLGVLLLLLFLWLLSFDIRLAGDWCFTPGIIFGAILLLLLGKLTLFVSRRWMSRSAPRAQITRPIPFTRPWRMLAITSLVLIGFALRGWDLMAVSLDVDEFSQTMYSLGVGKTGFFPNADFGSFSKRATTYELVDYFIAASIFVFGESETAFRVPSLILGTLTIGLIAWVGYRMFGWWTGFVSALIYALHPACIYWARNAFWPAHAGFFVLLTVWCFYEAVRTRALRARFLSAATLAFICGYLCWEGSGFLLPALFIGMLVLQWGRFFWIKNWHLWRCVFLIGCVVLIQQSHRKISAPPNYLQVGANLGEISTPSLVYLDPNVYNPAYYLPSFLFYENNYALTLLVVFGMVFFPGNRRLRYLFAVGIALFLLYSQMLPAYSIRYSHPYITLLILSGTGVVFHVSRRVVEMARTMTLSAWTRRMGLAAAAGAVVLLVLATNPFVLKAYNLSTDPTTGYFGMRRGMYRNDYRGAARFVAQHIQPGDAVISVIPHLFEYYAGCKSDYSMSTMFTKSLLYDGGGDVPTFIDKLRGRPSVRGLEDLQNVRNRSSRVWLVLVPSFGDVLNPDVDKYLARNQRVVYESYRAKVVLLDGAQRPRQGTEWKSPAER